MKRLFIAACVVMLTVFARGADSRIDSSAIGTTVKIIGPLGVPLGKVVRIEGTVLKPGRSKAEADYGVRYMEVTKVDGVVLKNPVTIQVEGEGPRLQLPKTNARMVFTGYQNGRFEGTPEEALKIRMVQTQGGWGFVVYFVVVRTEK